MKLKIFLFCFFSIFLNNISCDNPALKINLNPPEENVKDTIEALKDIDKLENDLRVGLDEDFDEEKKKLLEIQKARVHDIVHGAFIALKSLIPNPIKASIRKALRDHLNGKGVESAAANPAKSMKAVDPKDTVNKINTLQQNILKLSKFKELNGDNIKNTKNLRKLNFNNDNDSNLIDDIVNLNTKRVNYDSASSSNDEYNSELFETNFPMRKPL